jgi:electron transfer flavoprotein alpha/beta subunit
MGADSALHLKDPAFDASTRWAWRGPWREPSRPRRGRPGVRGQQGVGGDNSQIPGLLAELLDLPQVTMAVKLDIAGRQGDRRARDRGAHEMWEASLPA